MGDAAALDALLGEELEPWPEHPLQEVVEDFFHTHLTEDEQEVYLLRYGEQQSIRQVAKTMGYASHRIIQVKLERIQDKLREHLNGRETTQSND